MAMSDLVKLENIRLRDGDIKAFPLATNMKAVKSGKRGWGDVEIAIDNKSASRLMLGDAIGILYIIGKDEWEKVDTTVKQ